MPWLLLLVGLLALVIRVIYVFGWHFPVSVLDGDAFYYHQGANLLADGNGFVDPYSWRQHNVLVDDAQHPPLYIILLAIPSLFGLRSNIDHQLFTCLIGAGSVVLVGLAGQRILGPRAGIFAAALAAVYPAFWLNDALVLSESLSIFITAAVILAGYRYAERKTLRRAAALGALVGLAALTRAELILLALLVIVPLTLLPWAGLRTEWRRRTAALVLAVAACLAIIAPWAAYNLSRFHRPEIISTGSGATLYVANCPSTWSGPYKGWWDYWCWAATPPPPGDSSDRDAAYRRAAVDFIAARKGQLPGEIVARVGRVWGLYHPLQQLRLDTIERRELPASRAGLGMFYVLAAAAVPGAVLLRRRRIPLSPLLAPIITVTVTVAVFYGTTRFRATAEPSIVLLATVTAAALWARWRGRRGKATPGYVPVDNAGDVEPYVESQDVCLHEGNQVNR